MNITASENETILEDNCRHPQIAKVWNSSEIVKELMATKLSDHCKQAILFNYPLVRWYMNH